MGRLIAIEGGDGSGKKTQSKLLADWARQLGYDVLEVSFPRHGEASAYYVEKYLNGAYGGADDVPADLGALPYAIDRFDAKDGIEKYLAKANSLVIADRYVASNLGHQGAKIDDESERKEFYKQNMMTEYEILGIPRPDINVVLLVPADVSQLNVDKKPTRGYTTKKRDIHEANLSHLEKTKARYEELCRLYPQDFTPIDCFCDGKLRTIDDIQAELRKVVQLEEPIDK